MFEPKRNIVLIGMPGAGKSTIGVLLAKRLSMAFVDTDVLIQTEQQRSLQKIVDAQGYRALRTIEEDIICGLQCEHHVIATGGSAVYSARAVEHLKASGTLVFLHVPIDELFRRVTDLATRGIAGPRDQSFEALYAERLTLYRQYADVAVECGDRRHQDVLEAVCAALSP